MTCTTSLSIMKDESTTVDRSRNRYEYD